MSRKSRQLKIQAGITIVQDYFNKLKSDSIEAKY